MKLVMTLLARDEVDIVDTQISFHLNAGVDFVIATDNRSQDGTTEVLEAYAREGHLHRIEELGDDLRQTEWVTRMARLAATEFGADWVINTDADEFWWPREGSLKDLLAAVPARYGVVRGAWRIFVPRPDDERSFAERMTVRLCTPDYHDHPFSTDSKSAHRAVPDVRVGRGNHEAFGAGLEPLRGWYPIEVLHFPLRTLDQCTRKYVLQFHALEKNPEKGTPGIVAAGYEAYAAGRPEDFYGRFVVDDAELERGLADGTLAVDTRLRDVLRTLSSGERVVFGRPTPVDEAVFAGETSVLTEADLGVALGQRIDDLETRVARMERGALSRLRLRPLPAAR
jgi:hypothetical protein